MVAGCTRVGPHRRLGARPAATEFQGFSRRTLVECRAEDRSTRPQPCEELRRCGGDNRCASGSLGPVAGSANTHVELVPYDPSWPARYEAAATELQSVFPRASVEHIGSTSVPGLSSKDTIDIAVGVTDVVADLTAERIAALDDLGFTFVPASFADDPDHAFFHRIIHNHRTEHVHVLRAGSDAWQERVLFRDFLRACPDAVARYEAVKRDLAGRFAEQRDEYVQRKQPVVEALLTEARAWRRDEQ